jgi:inositol-phosphate phosphatase / L-galactose 1-phosphate phosphatase / histidinol-phosphatase
MPPSPRRAEPGVAIDLVALAAFAGHLADIGRDLLVAAEAGQREVALKADRSFVTDLDREIEQRLRREITAFYPDHGLIGEEEGRERESAALQWVLDPIDGTAPFIAGVPVYATLVAFAVEGAPVVGVADFPAAGRRFTGVSGQPTLQNGEPCSTREAVLDGAILACMNPDFFADEERPALDRLRAATAWRIYGASSLAYGQLAASRIDICLDTRLQVYDFACYRPIVEGAGGVVTDWRGARLTLNSGPRVLAAGSAALHEAAMAIVREY